MCGYADRAKRQLRPRKSVCERERDSGMDRDEKTFVEILEPRITAVTIGITRGIRIRAHTCYIYIRIRYSCFTYIIPTAGIRQIRRV